MVGGGTNIPLNHQAWFECSPLNHNNPRRLNGTVVDLIDPCTHSWKPDLIRAMYPYPEWFEILKTPLSKTSSIEDKLLWKYSSSGAFKVKAAYEILLEDSNPPTQSQNDAVHIQDGVWNKVWRVKDLKCL